MDSYIQTSKNENLRYLQKNVIWIMISYNDYLRISTDNIFNIWSFYNIHRVFVEKTQILYISNVVWHMQVSGEMGGLWWLKPLPLIYARF